MRLAFLLILVIVTSCVLTSTVEKSICTQEDIDNGTCGDPGGGSPPAEDPPVLTPQITTPSQLEAEAIARDNAPGMQCGWDRCGPLGGYVCHGNNITCILTRQNNVFCSTDPRGCFNTDYVAHCYQCPEWNGR